MGRDERGRRKFFRWRELFLWDTFSKRKSLIP
jgi:hypothetical protein